MSKVLAGLGGENTQNLEPIRKSVVGGRIGAYGAAVLAAFAGLAVTALLVKPLAGPFFIPQFAVVVGAALYGGLGPGLVTMLLSCVGFYAVFFAPAVEGFEAYRLVAFALVSASFAYLAARMRHLKAEAESARATAEAARAQAEAARVRAEEAQAKAEAAEAEARLIGAQQERLVAVVSHDLRSPLLAISVTAEHLRHGVSERQASGVSRIVTSARRMQTMIRDLLDFARARQGSNLPVQTQPTRLGDICRSAIEEVRTAKPERSVVLDVSGDDSANLDPARVEQVVFSGALDQIQRRRFRDPVRRRR